MANSRSDSIRTGFTHPHTGGRHDRRTYRTALAWQNTACNQPPHPSFFICTRRCGQVAARVGAR
ncbi:hypothetical protein AB0E64_23155 [Streptomyces caelestis]